MLRLILQLLWRGRQKSQSTRYFGILLIFETPPPRDYRSESKACILSHTARPTALKRNKLGLGLLPLSSGTEALFEKV